MITLGIIGAGNIVRSRHIPALLRRKEFVISGIADLNSQKAEDLAERFGIPQSFGFKTTKDLINQKWFQSLHAVLVGVPPKAHYDIVKICLESGKHVLTEKPFVTDPELGKELIRLAKSKKLMLGLNHNFQFSRSFLKLTKLFKSGSLGDIKSIYCIQISNDARRLPIWADDLPFGLFYDESPHLFYLLNYFAPGKVRIKRGSYVKSSVKQNTPQIINLDFLVGSIPASVYINFESPISEWHFSLIAEKQIAVVDLFRDILVVLPNDGQHLTKEVFRTSFLTSVQHWKGFVRNGIDYVMNNLFYGTDIVHQKFYNAVKENDETQLAGITGEDGLAINQLQHDVISLIMKDK